VHIAINVYSQFTSVISLQLHHTCYQSSSLVSVELHIDTIHPYFSLIILT